MVHVKASRPGAPDAAVADIYRFEDGRIVEHWDVLQQVPMHAVHDHPMF
jgi:predicted SnoaL-like aldol condensation-catalyzing enzyme